MDCSLPGSSIRGIFQARVLEWVAIAFSAHGPQPCLNQWNYEQCRVGPPKTDGSRWRVLTNMAHWRREWQTTSLFLPWEPHEQYEKAKERKICHKDLSRVQSNSLKAVSVVICKLILKCKRKFRRQNSPGDPGQETASENLATAF